MTNIRDTALRHARDVENDRETARLRARVADLEKEREMLQDEVAALHARLAIATERSRCYCR
jgi:hypothetical protein